MAGPDGEMCESGGTLSGGEMHTKFCLEIAEKKGGSRGNELDKPGSLFFLSALDGHLPFFFTPTSSSQLFPLLLF